jgi:mannose-6-phosphate isomerase-like protein (cupin superfamily)
VRKLAIPERIVPAVQPVAAARRSREMADVTVKRLDELDSYQGQFLYAGKGLGVTAWGMNVLKLPSGWKDYPNHDHLKDGQEEVYVVLQGSAKMEAGGESWQLEPGMLARVGASQQRKITPGSDGVVILALGGTPGKVYQPPSRGKK